jgi:hypothetical protein
MLTALKEMQQYQSISSPSHLMYGFYFVFTYSSYCEPGSSVGIATELRAGRSGDRIPVGGEIFRTCPDRPWGPPSLLHNGYWVFPGVKERPGLDADP